jgi:hypothetical protein
VNEGRGLERVPFALMAQGAARLSPQFRVHERRKLVRRLRITRGPCTQEGRNRVRALRTLGGVRFARWSAGGDCNVGRRRYSHGWNLDRESGGQACC